MRVILDSLFKAKNNNVDVINDYNTSIIEKHNFYVRPPSFSGDAIHFSWSNRKMYSNIIGVDDELWDIFKEGIKFIVDTEGIMVDRKGLI